MHLGSLEFVEGGWTKKGWTKKGLSDSPSDCSQHSYSTVRSIVVFLLCCVARGSGCAYLVPDLEPPISQFIMAKEFITLTDSLEATSVPRGKKMGQHQYWRPVKPLYRYAVLLLYTISLYWYSTAVLHTFPLCHTLYRCSVQLLYSGTLCC